MSTVVVGAQTPRIMSSPEEGDYSLAERALEWLDEVVGFDLDPWQKLVLRESLAEREPGRWAATEVGLVVPRQNGKGAILEARELVSLFLLREPLVIHSAHQFKTAQEHFLRLIRKIEDVPELLKRLRDGSMKGGIRTAAGEQGIFLESGARLRILARKGGSGRGFSAPFVAFDEAMDLPEGTVGDMVPTQSAMARRQRWYTGSAVDQFHHLNGVAFARVRERGLRGDEPRLLFMEWSLDFDRPDDISDEVMRDDEAIAEANPGYGIRIFREAIDDELNTFASRTAAVERFDVGDWPPTTIGDQTVFPIETWLELVDRSSKLVDQVCLAVDTTPDRSWSSISAAGLNYDGLPHAEVVDHRRGTDWVVPRLLELESRHDVRAIVCGGSGAAASLEPEARDAGVRLELLSAADEANGFGLICDLVTGEAERQLRHLGSPELLSAVKGATKRRVGDRFAWDRRDATVDISPLVSTTEALWASAEQGWDFDREVSVF